MRLAIPVVLFLLGAGATPSRAGFNAAPAASVPRIAAAAVPIEAARTASPAGDRRSTAEDAATARETALEIDEVPLSPEDFALLASLASGTATTSTMAHVDAPAPGWLAPAPLPRVTLLLPRPRIGETVGRTIADAFESHATIVETARRYVPGDSAVIRGQSGHRIALYKEGVPLQHALTASRETPGWFTLDPWLLEQLMVEMPGALAAGPRGAAGSIMLVERPAPDTPGFGADLSIEARSADRSTASHAAVSAAGEWIGARVAGGYSDHRALRISTSSVGRDYGGGYQRAVLSARARLLGRPSDPVKVSSGADFDRLLNVPRVDLGEPLLIDRATERLLLFVRAEAGGDTLGASLLLARQTFSRRTEVPIASSPETLESATSLHARGVVTAAPFPNVIASAGGSAEGSEADITSPREGPIDSGRTRSFFGFASIETASSRLSGLVTLGISRLETSLDRSPEAVRVDATRLLSQGAARISILGPFGFRAGWSQAHHVPTVQDLRDARGSPDALEPERSLSVDFGPSIYHRDGWLELFAFSTWLRNAIEPESLASRRLINLPSVRLIGAELTGGWAILDRLRLSGALTWTEGEDGTSGAPVVTFPSVTGRASLRYDFSARNAFVEAHFRGTSRPLYVASIRAADPPASLAGLAPSAFTRFGVMGGTDLGTGFRLILAIENVFDAPHRAPTSLAPGAGVDVRAALAYALP